MLPRSGVDVAHVVEEDAVDVVAEEGKAQFGGMEQQRIAAERKAGDQVARAGLVVREAAVRRAAAAEEVLGERNIVERIERRRRCGTGGSSRTGCCWRAPSRG